ncbi:hypothetical protein HK097_008750 [Rhizophlyctis rosea]|uniref:Calcineurin-like phosphoesterase domain-containing protein n=1 Tax=Rhizophlyctis rosea TaxID=64517 RepID=A0AAD5X0X0_9FUNG|nr:hypothetical protein HK097_008750 [Rhizophlyctis rosea]
MAPPSKDHPKTRGVDFQRHKTSPRKPYFVTAAVVLILLVCILYYKLFETNPQNANLPHPAHILKHADTTPKTLETTPGSDDSIHQRTIHESLTREDLAPKSLDHFLELPKSIPEYWNDGVFCYIIGVLDKQVVVPLGLIPLKNEFKGFAKRIPGSGEELFGHFEELSDDGGGSGGIGNGGVEFGNALGAGGGGGDRDSGSDEEEKKKGKKTRGLRLRGTGASTSSATKTLKVKKHALCAFSDVHGDLEAVRVNLRACGVLNGNDDWVGEKTRVVVVGDSLDRGPGTITIFDLLRRLADQALASGGKVTVFAGNHEAMNIMGIWRYVTDEEQRTFGGKAARRAAFARTGNSAWAHKGYLPAGAVRPPQPPFHTSCCVWFLDRKRKLYGIYENFGKKPLPHLFDTNPNRRTEVDDTETDIDAELSEASPSALDSMPGAYATAPYSRPSPPKKLWNHLLAFLDPFFAFPQPEPASITTNSSSSPESTPATSDTNDTSTRHHRVKEANVSLVDFGAEFLPSVSIGTVTDGILADWVESVWKKIDGAEARSYDVKEKCYSNYDCPDKLSCIASLQHCVTVTTCGATGTDTATSAAGYDTPTHADTPSSVTATTTEASVKGYEMTAITTASPGYEAEDSTITPTYETATTTTGPSYESQNTPRESPNTLHESLNTPDATLTTSHEPTTTPPLRDPFEKAGVSNAKSPEEVESEHARGYLSQIVAMEARFDAPPMDLNQDKIEQEGVLKEELGRLESRWKSMVSTVTHPGGGTITTTISSFSTDTSESVITTAVEETSVVMDERFWGGRWWEREEGGF